jgi:hypothetical protein
MAHSITFIPPKLNIHMTYKMHSNDLQNNIHISFKKKITHKLYYTENQVLSNTNPTKNRGKSLQIVGHMSVDLLP